MTEGLRARWGDHNGKYILLNKIVVPCPNLLKWADWIESAYVTGERIVARDQIGGCLVSTVFLGLDHNFSGTGHPRVFETMIRRGNSWDDQWRCETWEQAEAQHKKACELVRKEIKEKVNE